MKLAILSDIHDHVWNLSACLSWLREGFHVEALVCCGDLCSPFIINLLGEGFEGRMWIVKGNNDGDLRLMALNAQKYSSLNLVGEFIAFELDNHRIAVNHYPEIARNITLSGEFDLVCYGHNHRHQIETLGQTQLVNPGTLMGWNPLNSPGERDIPATFVLYNTETRVLESFQINQNSDGGRRVDRYEPG